MMMMLVLLNNTMFTMRMYVTMTTTMFRSIVYIMHRYEVPEAEDTSSCTRVFITFWYCFIVFAVL